MSEQELYQAIWIQTRKVILEKMLSAFAMGLMVGFLLGRL